MMRCYIIACLVVSLVVVPSVALAGNDDAVLIGDDAAMLGGAVTATVDGGAALWYNPAGIARSQLRTLDLTATAYALNIYSIEDAISFSGGESTDAEIEEIVVIPTSISLVRPVGDNVRIGGGVVRSSSARLRGTYGPEWRPAQR